MNLHTMTNVPGARTRRKRVGCGESSGHGKTSCRGAKGQMARSGHKRKAGFEGGQMTLIRRIPKRGFNHAKRQPFALVNVGVFAAFDAGTEITAAALAAVGLIADATQPLKVLGDGELDRKLTVKAQAFSASARAKIEAAGGSCDVLE